MDTVAAASIERPLVNTASGSTTISGSSSKTPDEATIRQFCMIDVEDQERIAKDTGTAEDALEPTADTALAFIQSYWDSPA